MPRRNLPTPELPTTDVHGRGDRTLATLLAESGTLAVPAALAQVRSLAQQIGELHTAGMIHGDIDPAVIPLDDRDVPRLRTPAPGTVLPRDCDWARLVPGFSRLPPIDLPATINFMRDSLERAGGTVDPRQIDLCQLGDIFCRMFTKGTSATYLRSARVKALVPTEVRPLLERMLGVNGQARFHDAQELLDALPAVAGPAAPADVARSSAVESALPFAKLGHYDIVRQIGQGGMGAVYEGYEPALDRKVAIKVLPDDLARSEEFVRRFQAEATAAARLIHPNIIQIYFIGEAAGRHFFAMQFVEGESLADLLHRRGKLAIGAALSIVEQALAGLSVAHEKGMVHRDIKPANILLDAQNRRALLADFGLVKSPASSGQGQTATGIVMGTVDYISPEQGQGRAVDARSDLYSVGVLLYRLLAGQLPFSADCPTAMIFQHVYEPAPDLAKTAPDVPAPLAAIVARLLAKSPADRYQDVKSLLAELRPLRAGRPQPIAAESSISSRPREVQATIVESLPLEAHERRPAGLSGARRRGWWKPLVDRARSLFRRHARNMPGTPGTEQQVDEAVAGQAREKEALAKLVAEGSSVLAELERQAQAQRQAARQARKGAASTSGGRSAQKTHDSELKLVAAAESLESQAAEQKERLESLRVRLAQAAARLQELQNQRDILNARLGAAGKRKKASSRPSTSGQRPFAWIAAALVIAAVGGGITWWQFTTEQVVKTEIPNGHVATSNGNGAGGAAVAIPDISGAWWNAFEGELKTDMMTMVVQKGEEFTAKCAYQHEKEGEIRWTWTGTITKEGRMAGRLIHTQAPKSWVNQTRTAVLTSDGMAMQGNAVFDTGGEQAFSWVRVKPEIPAKLGLPPPAPEVFLDDLPEKAFSMHWLQKGVVGKHGATAYPPLYPQKCRLQGRVLSHALSLHPPDSGESFAFYQLDRPYTVFRATAALNTVVPDDGLRYARANRWESKARTPLTFRVLGDGKRLWESRPLATHGDSQECEVKITGVEQLRLEVHSPGPSNFGWALWADPRLLPGANATAAPKDGTVGTVQEQAPPRVDLIRFYDTKHHEHVYTYDSGEALGWRQKPEMQNETVVGRVALTSEPDTTRLYRAYRKNGLHYFYLNRPPEAKQTELEEFHAYVWTKPGDGRIAMHACVLPDMTDLFLDTDPKAVANWSDDTLKGIGIKRKETSPMFYVYPAAPSPAPPADSVAQDVPASGQASKATKSPSAQAGKKSQRVSIGPYRSPVVEFTDKASPNWIFKEARVGTPMESDKEYFLARLPAELVGGTLIWRDSGSGGWLPAGSVKALKDCKVYIIVRWKYLGKVVFDDATFARLDSEGWKDAGEVKSTFPAGEDWRWKALVHEVSAGDVSLPATSVNWSQRAVLFVFN